ncbi:MAG: hypothetical protein V2I57_09650 [Xanthomonadales bacterium]|jgi:hypothetical protein|nr:hypothetical protein [Xanthomonadales bacterium]
MYEPSVYLSALYRADLERFRARVRAHGSPAARGLTHTTALAAQDDEAAPRRWGAVYPADCGMQFHVTIVRHFEAGERLFAFAATTAELNLLNQGIYTYFPEDHRAWLDVTPPFVDLRTACGVHVPPFWRPDSVVRAVRFAAVQLRSEGARMTRLEMYRIHTEVDRRLSEVVRHYAEFFLQDYLPAVLTLADFRRLTTEGLLTCLRDDPDVAAELLPD